MIVRSIVLFLMVVVALPAHARSVRVITATVTFHPIPVSHHRRKPTCTGRRSNPRMAATNSLDHIPYGSSAVVTGYYDRQGKLVKLKRPISRVISDKMGPRHRREAKRKKRPNLRVDLYVPQNRITPEILAVSGKRCRVLVYV